MPQSQHSVHAPNHLYISSPFCPEKLKVNVKAERTPRQMLGRLGRSPSVPALSCMSTGLWWWDVPSTWLCACSMAHMVPWHYKGWCLHTQCWGLLSCQLQLTWLTDFLQQLTVQKKLKQLHWFYWKKMVSMHIISVSTQHLNSLGLSLLHQWIAGLHKQMQSASTSGGREICGCWEKPFWVFKAVKWSEGAVGYNPTAVQDLLFKQQSTLVIPYIHHW